MLQYGNTHERPGSVTTGRLRALAAELSRSGLNLFASLPLATLPPSLRRRVRTRPSDRSLVLVGHGGRRLWRRLPTGRLRGPDPVDAWSLETTLGRLGRRLPGLRLTVRYPGPAMLPLQQLGQVAGWTHPSPLGSGLNRRFGPWFAYRCAILTDGRLPRLVATNGVNRCAGCAERPCLSQCPAGALTVEFAPQVSACGQYRLRPASRCAGRCLAREACPRGRAHRYDEAAMAYHYGVSLAVLRHWWEPAGD